MRAAIIGYGKMGKEIETILLSQGHEISVIVNDSSQLINLTNGSSDVAIEFSNPESATKNIRYCLENGIPVISGTTGWLEAKSEIDEICNQNNGAFLYASNFSIGVNLFFQLNKQLAALMEPYQDYRAKMHEIHHTSKKDAPSGTAITLAEDIIDHHSRYADWKHGEPLSDGSLEITHDRIAHVPGTHIIQYQSEIDEITIQHKAHSRKGFALGAVLAAEWIINKQGVFTMSDVLFS